MLTYGKEEPWPVAVDANKYGLAMLDKGINIFTPQCGSFSYLTIDHPKDFFKGLTITIWKTKIALEKPWF